MSEQEIDDITYVAKQDAEIKISDIIGDIFDISQYELSFEIICRVNIMGKNKSN